MPAEQPTFDDGLGGDDSCWEGTMLGRAVGGREGMAVGEVGPPADPLGRAVGDGGVGTFAEGDGGTVG